MDDGLTWESIKAQAEAEKQPRESLAQQVARSGDNAALVIRLARACVRDGRFTEALSHYDHAELLGHYDAHTERRLVALHAEEAQGDSWI